jgi:hypothetical protein
MQILSITCPKKTPICANRLGNHLKDVSMIALLTAPERLNQPEQAHRYMVEMASIETVLDSEGVPVPAYFKRSMCLSISLPWVLLQHYLPLRDTWTATKL